MRYPLPENNGAENTSAAEVLADAVPLGFIRSADHSVIDMAGAYICRWFDPFVRTQIGLALKGEDSYYKIVDLLVMANTDNHVRALIDVLCAYSNINIFTYGVPHRKNQAALAYYLHGITKLKKRVEELTGVEITDARLREAIKLCNRERELLKEISLIQLMHKL